MADSVKGKNMPTISPNVYSGLQKWVNRASVSLRGRRRNRNNSDTPASTTNQRNNLENMTSKPSKIVPVHGRSRSTPVEMPDSLTFETFPQKIPRVVKQTRNERERKDSSELSDDNSSRGSLREAKDMSLQTKSLSNILSKSEGNLLDWRYSTRSKSLPRHSHGHRRKSSLGQALNRDSNGSEFDVNFNGKNFRSSQALNKTNKKDNLQSIEHKASSVGFEQSPTMVTNPSKNIHSRLDMWLEKNTRFQEYRQSSFESTSSSEEIFYESKSRKDETKHCLRDLQTALDELVSGCGQRNSIIMDNNDKSRKRKISIKDAGPMFNITVDIDHNTQEERKTTYRNERCGSSGDSGLAKDDHIVVKVDEKYVMEERHDLESSYDSIDGYIDARDQQHECDINNIGPMNVTCATNPIIAHASDEACTTSEENTGNVNSISMKDGCQAPGNKKDILYFQNKDDLLPKAEKSKKKSTTSLNSIEKSRKVSPAVFEDDDLTAFAMKCVEASESLEKDDKRSKSDSDDEKKTALDLDYVYIPKNTESSTHPTITFDEKSLPFSDDEVYTSKRKSVTLTSSKPKRNSEDSLDGLVLFNKEIDFDNNETNSYSSNETENTKETLKADNNEYGLRKFPSMPLFYVPSDGTRKSLGKSLWKKLKSFPRSNENRAPTPNNLKSRNSQPHMQTDPFYHGDNDELGPIKREKSNSMAVGDARTRNFRRRLSLIEVKRSVSTPADASRDNTSRDKNVEKKLAKPLESKC